MLVLPNVLGYGFGEGELTIEMSYIGGVLSVNRYKTAKGITRREVQRWMDDLAWIVKVLVSSQKLEFRLPIHIRLDGYFGDARVPDLSNLIKVVGDALQEGLGVNDKNFRFEDGEVTTGAKTPMIKITLNREGIKIPAKANMGLENDCGARCYVK